MKTPSSRPPFRSATRHYHRYREENRGGWEDWIDGKKAGPARRFDRWKWIILALGGIGICGLIGAVVFNAI